jgi:hypothetical protein
MEHGLLLLPACRLLSLSLPSLPFLRRARSCVSEKFPVGGELDEAELVPIDVPIDRSTYFTDRKTERLKSTSSRPAVSLILFLAVSQL